MYSLRYGTLPIVRRVGGLADSVVNVESLALGNGTATGFVFDDYSAPALAATIERAVELYRQPEIWKRVMKAGMTADWSWASSAANYVDTYRTALERRHERESDGRQ